MATIAALLTRVKTELRIPDTELDSWMTGLFLEILTDFTAISLYAELFVPNTALTLTTATETVAAPADLQHIARVYYSPSGSTQSYGLYPWRVGSNAAQTGSPKFYRRAGASLSLLPFDQISSADSLKIDYYKRVTSLASNAEFPIPDLENTVLRKVIARAALYHNDERTPARESLAAESFKLSQGGEHALI